MTVNIVGIVVIAVFYVVIVIVGIVSARKFRSGYGQNTTELDMVAGRNLGLFVGTITTAGE